ncbi:hypothetical protein Mzhil_1064 [Methanosalsum zhilinae DSM 4017]|uniref:Transposase IS30-like HTH domain-containing protein n=1 Tax=Methanosalsum zhilinae (strain DSM 4017 / NBRC 107636 / OCM 62 / WeN5) TaxID=679901 RepID=F7XLZ3_METZD|nr:hypothetical protein Mzhil_1064 [Methanosalsum zhilinae DSM 4017]
MKWDENEETKFVNLFNSGKSIEEIGYILGRNKESTYRVDRSRASGRRTWT